MPADKRDERPHRYQLQLEPAQRAEWQAAADADGRPLSAWIRRMVECARVMVSK